MAATSRMSVNSFLAAKTALAKTKSPPSAMPEKKLRHPEAYRLLISVTMPAKRVSMGWLILPERCPVNDTFFEMSVVSMMM